MRVLGIESSCDETAASVIEAKGDNLKVLSNIVFSQISIHKRYGGVVPEVAARNHIKKILPVIEKALTSPLTPLQSTESGTVRDVAHPLLTKERVAVRRRPGEVGEGVDVIAVTVGPGLISSLIIGIETAKTLARVWDKPIVAVNHLAGHIYSAWFTSPASPKPQRGEPKPTGEGGLNEKLKPKFPALALIVSGGHTELVLMRGHLQFETIGQTRDDAAGECFDKVAKMLDLGYPGGPAVAATAAKLKIKNSELQTLTFPRPMMYDDNFDFSFSGIKTAVLYKIQKDRNYKRRLPEYCAAFQQAVIDVLVHKTLKAARQYQVKSIILAGGVAANRELRRQLGEKVTAELPKVSYHIPAMQYTTDNAAMIAAAGYFMTRLRQGSGGQAKKFTPWPRVKVDCNLKLKLC